MRKHLSNEYVACVLDMGATFTTSVTRAENRAETRHFLCNVSGLDRTVAHIIAEQWGGVVIAPIGGSALVRFPRSDSTIRMLESVIPYMIARKHQAQLFLELWEQSDLFPGRGKPRTDAQREVLEEYGAELRKLNENLPGYRRGKYGKGKGK